MCENCSKKIIRGECGAVGKPQDQMELDTYLAVIHGLEGNEQDVPVVADIRRDLDIFPIIQSFKNRMHIYDDRVLVNPVKILNTILYESKNKFCWIFANSLYNYVEWLYTHSINVAIISLMIAERQKYSDEELMNIGLGAFLHDVGKLLVPKSIIQKPGLLNTTEMSFIKQHCEEGLNFLLPFRLPKDCTDIVLQHHERLDGSGYPNGLMEDEISRNAKIVMIADSIDAITSIRPYKLPQEIEVAICILKNDEEKYSRKLVSMLDKILIS